MTSDYRNAAVLVWRWIKAAGPFILIVGSAVYFFRDAIIDSVRNSPHPELIYVMGGVFLVGVLANVWNLGRNLQDGVLVEYWRDSPLQARASLDGALPEASAFTPVLRLLASREDAQRTAAIESELLAAEQRLGERASLPDFLTSAMIGLGLVGTFIGLLSVLQDLAGLFSAMSGPEAGGGDAANVFGELVRKLQEPMRGMSTAFLASLYGLAGSLVLGVLTISVKHTGYAAVAAIREIVHARTLSAAPAPQATEAAQWQAMFDTLREEHRDFLNSTGQALHEVGTCLRDVPRLVEALNRRSQIDEHVQRLLGQGAHWNDAWEQIADQLRQLRAEQAAQTRAVTQALVAHTEVGARLLEQGEARNRIEAANDARFQETLQQNRMAFEQMESRLRALTALLVMPERAPENTRTERGD